MLQVALSNYSDAALLRVDTRTPPDTTLRRLFGWRLDLARPSVGDECVAIGWTENEAGTPRMVASRGTIIDLLEAGVAPSYRNYPTIVMDARVLPGMSGGPVFSLEGES